MRIIKRNSYNKRGTREEGSREKAEQIQTIKIQRQTQMIIDIYYLLILKATK